MTSTAPLVEDFKRYFKALHQSDLSKLCGLYADDVVFRDPVHEISGLVELEDYFTSICAGLSDCHFEYLDELVSEQSCYIKWVMHFRHPRLGNQLISVRGISHLKIRDKIEFHEDFYDMGSMLYEQLPVLGRLVRRLRLRLAN